MGRKTRRHGQTPPHRPTHALRYTHLHEPTTRRTTLAHHGPPSTEVKSIADTPGQVFQAISVHGEARFSANALLTVFAPALGSSGIFQTRQFAVSAHLFTVRGLGVGTICTRKPTTRTTTRTIVIKQTTPIMASLSFLHSSSTHCGAGTGVAISLYQTLPDSSIISRHATPPRNSPHVYHSNRYGDARTHWSHGGPTRVARNHIRAMAIMPQSYHLSQSQ